MTKDFFRTFRGISEVKLFNLATQTIYNLPVPLDLSIDNGIQEKRIPTRNSKGEQVFSNAFTQAKDPILRTVFPTMNAETLELKIGRKFASKSLEYTIPKTLEVASFPENGDGNIVVPVNIDLDTAITAVQVAATEGELSEMLTVTIGVAPAVALTTGNVTVVTSITGTTLYFCGSDFVGGTPVYSESVSVLLTLTKSVIALGAELKDFFKMYTTVVTTDNELVVLTAPKIKVSFQGSGVMPSSEQTEVIFYMYTPAGQCDAYNLMYTGFNVTC